MGTGISTGTSKVLFYTTFNLFPSTGLDGFIYVDNTANFAYLWDTVSLTYVQVNAGPDIPDDPTPLTFVNVATVNILSFSPVYYNGVANDGVGATLTGGTFGNLTDGSAVGFIDFNYSAVLGDYILVKNQVAQQQNGLYVINAIGSSTTLYILTRIVDYDTSATLYPLQISVLLGQDNALKYFTQTTVNPVIGNAVTGKLVFQGSSLQAPLAQIAFVDTVTTAALPTCVYANGSSVGVPGLGATLIASVVGALPAISGLTPSITPLSGANRILVKNQADPSKNGDYVVIKAGSSIQKWVLKRINFTAAAFDRYTRVYIVSNVNSTLAGQIYYPSINNTRTNLTIGTTTTGNISFIPSTLYQPLLGYTPANKAGDTFTGAISATNLSGTNAGDETATTIKTKLGAATTALDGYLTATNWTTFNSKQAALTSGTNIKTINGSSILGSGNLIASNIYLGNTLSMTYETPDTEGNFATDVYPAASVTVFTVYSSDADYYTPWLSKIEGNSSYVLQIGSLQGVYGLYLVTAKTLDAGNQFYHYTLTLIKASGTFVFGDVYSISFTKVSLGLTLSTTGSSGAATLVGSTLNVPQYVAGANSNDFVTKPNYTFRGAVLNNNTSSVTADGGVTLSTSASVQARAVINTNFASKLIGARYYASVVSTGRYSGTRGTTLLWFMNSGFLYTCDFNISDTAYGSTCQQFYGMQSSIVDLTYGGTSTIAVNTLINCIGVGSDAADTNLQIFHNDATGTCTKVDLGASFPANRTAGAISTTVYSVLIYNAPGTNDVKVKVTNAETGVSVENTLSTNLPASTLGLNFFASRAQGTGGGVTNSGQFDLMKLGVYSIL